MTYPVSVQVFEAPSPDPLNDESFRVVVAQPMDKTPIMPLFTLIEAGGYVVGYVLYHMMDAYTVNIPPPHPLTRFLPVSLPSPTFPPIPFPCTPSP